MLKTESDLMKGIDDKFQKLLSQFEMNMNILEMKSKRQQFLIGQTKDEKDNSTAAEDGSKEISTDMQKKEAPAIENNSGDSLRDVFSDVSSKGKRETGSEKSESMVTVREIDTKTRPKPKTYSMKLEMKDHIMEQNDDDPTEQTDSMGNVLKYISECAEMQNRKNKKRKKMISFSGQNEAPAMKLENNETSSSLVGNKNKNKKKKPLVTTASNENLSASSSKRKSDRSNHDVVRKCSKTVTNISKKGKKRNLKHTNTISKDWISFNRNNAGKNLKTLPKNKAQLTKKEDLKQPKKAPIEKPKNDLKKDPVELDYKQANKIEHFDTVESKLIDDFFKNDFLHAVDVKSKNRMNDLMRKAPEKIQFKKRNDERISFRSKSPLKAVAELTKPNEFNSNKSQDFFLKKLNDNRRNIQANNRDKENKFIRPGEKIVAKKNITNDKENHRLDLKIGGKFDDKKSVVSNLELGKVLYDKFKEQRDIRSALDVPRAKSEIKVTSAPSEMMGKNEDHTDLEDVKVELDEFFSEIPFVVGRSISRTFNLGLSFQHAMSMLKRVHSKREVKDVLSIGRPESVALSESSHCMGIGGTCEAMFSSDWTKEDEEAWEENPWDPDLNRRRPKCTCLPNNCTTLKNVLKQLTIKNPGFNMRSLKPSLSSTTNKVESEIDGLKKPALKRAKSQTRTELLRNIRTIQIQLTPSTEILK